MSSELLSSGFTERYLRSRGVECFRGQHDGQYFSIVKSSCGPLHVHLTMPAERGQSVSIQITEPRFFRAADHPRLMRLARRWNRRGTPVRAVLCRSIDPTRIGVVAETFVQIDGAVAFEEFAHAVDASVAGAAEFFGLLAAALGPRHARPPRVWLPDAS